MYKFLAVGNDRDGLVQYFKRSDMSRAEKAASVLQQSTGVASGVKRVEPDEDTMLALINSAIMLGKLAKLQYKGDSNGY